MTPHALLTALTLLGTPAQATEPHVPSDGTRDARFHLRLDTAATWGIGGQMYLGTNVHLQGQNTVWASKKATGTVDVGLQVAYGNEAIFLAPWIDPDTTSGATHRVQLVGTFGHTFHAGPQRRVAVGMHVFAGWNHWRSDYAIRMPSVDVQGQAVVSRDLFVAGGQLTLACRISEVVGIHLVIAAPLPTPSDYAVGMFGLGIGPTFYLR